MPPQHSAWGGGYLLRPAKMRVSSQWTPHRSWYILPQHNRAAPGRRYAHICGGSSLLNSLCTSGVDPISVWMQFCHLLSYWIRLLCLFPSFITLSLWSLSLSQIPLPLSLSVYLSESPWAMSLRRVLVYLQTIIMLNRSEVPFWILEINVDIYC